MAHTLAQAIAYARATPKRDGGSWSGWCASFNYRAGGFRIPYPTATDAGSAAGLLSNAQPAPLGAQHYWSGGAGNAGHCSIELGGGLQLMASSAVTDRWGVDMGTITLPNYARARPAMRYRGWSMSWGRSERLALTSTSTEEEDDMYTQADRERDADTRERVESIYRALFEIHVDDFAGRQAGLGRAIKDIRDALFKQTEVPASTTGTTPLPGGVLTSLAALVAESKKR